MVEVSLKFMALISFDAISASAVILAVAAICDVNTMRIPNWLTLPSVFAGLVLLVAKCLDGYSWELAGILAGVSFAFTYLLWRARLWGGGDAKAALALFLLVAPLYPPLSFIAAFCACLSTTIAVRHTAEVILRRADCKQRPLGPLLLASFPLSLLLLKVLGCET